MRVWFKDEAADLGKTMAELDKQLRRVQPFAGLREPRAGRAPRARHQSRREPPALRPFIIPRRTPRHGQVTASRYDLTDFTKLASEFQIPGVDWQELLASQQKNLQALGKANQVLVEGAQTVMRREIEILQKAMARSPRPRRS